MLPGVHVDFK